MEIETVHIRRSGRPDARASQDLDRHILDTATRLFVEQGFSATSMEQVAAAAGSGKQTIYRRYPSKEALFKAVTGELGAKIVALASEAQTAYDNPLAALREACSALLDFVCKPDAVAIYRILMAESERFPALIDHAMCEAKAPVEGILRRYIQSAQDAGQLRGGSSAELMGRALSGLVTGWALQQALFGKPGYDDLTERAAYFNVAWGLFLRGAATDVSDG